MNTLALADSLAKDRYKEKISYEKMLTVALLLDLATAGQVLAQGKIESFSGKVTAVDPAEKAMVIESVTGDR